MARISSAWALGGGLRRPLRPLRRRWCESALRGPGRSMQCFAMVNVELASPSLVLGLGLIGAGVLLFSIRKSKPALSRDSDVIVSSLITVTGGTLVFQGWRLDPLLLLCQLMTCTVAISFALEALNLREQIQMKGEPSRPSASQSGPDGKEAEEPWYQQDFGLPQSSETPFGLWGGSEESERYQGAAYSRDRAPAGPPFGLGPEGTESGWREDIQVWEDYSEGVTRGRPPEAPQGEEDDPVNLVEDWE
eukprot:evm.model.scf_220.8 EVM.evm.TU.scf_220.8   scf_220:101516-105087(-)